jgi:GAF domain-containing protein
MADDELRRLLEGLLSDIPEPTEDRPVAPVEDRPGEARTAEPGPGSVTKLEKHAIHLQTASQVSQAASSLLDLEELLPRVVDLIQGQFGFYYVGIFLVDERDPEPGEWAVLEAGSGEPGRQMVTEGHRLRVGDNSMIGWCIAHEQARIALDVGKDAVRFDNPLLPETRSEMALPLVSRGRVIGAMSIQSTLQAAFTEEDTTVLQTMADQLANAIENARLYTQAQQRTTELAALLDVSTAASSALDLDEVLFITAEQITKATGADGCTLSHWDQRADAIVTWIEVRLDDHEPDEAGTSYSLDQYPVTRTVLENRQPHAILADDPQADPAEAALMSTQGLTALLMLPLIAGERVIGLVEVEHSQPSPRFPPTPAEIRLCEALAHHAADAIEDARLSQERQRRLTELAIVNEIGQALASSWELDTFLETVYWQVGRLFDTTNFYIATYAQESDEWISAFHVEQGRRQPTARYSLGSGLTGYIIRSRQPVLFCSVEENVAFKKAHGVDIIGEMARSWLGVPLITADKVLGAMAVQNYEQEHLYSQEDLTLFSTIAAQVAGALDNLRLLEETRRRAREMEAINEVGRAISSVLDVNTVLRQIVDITKARFGHYFVSIELVEGEQISFQHGSVIGNSGQRLAGPIAPVDLHQGRSIVAQAAQTGQPVLVHDVLEDAHYLPVAQLPDTRSELAVPIEVKGRVIGVLDVQSDRPGAYGETDIVLLRSLVSQAGVAIENARLFEERERRIAELAVVNEIGRTLSIASDVQELLETVYERVSRLFQTDSFYLAVYEAAHDEWILALDMERGERQPSSRYKVDTGLTGYIIRTRQPLLLHNFDQVVALCQSQDIKFVGDPALSWLGIPLVAADQVIGVMAIQDYEREDRYSDQDLTLFSTIGAQVANALENVRLLDETRQRADEMKILHGMSLELAQEQQDLNSLLETATRRAMDLLDTDGAGIWLWHEDVQELELVITYQVGDTDFTGQRLKSGEGLSGHAFAQGSVQVVNDYTTWNGQAHAFQQAPFVSAMAVPMAWQTQIVGVLAFTRSQPGRPFQAEEQNLAGLLANQTASVVQNAALFEQIQARAQEQTILLQVTEALGRSLEMRDLLDTALDALLQQMGFDAALVSLWDQDAGMLTLVAEKGLPETLVAKLGRDGLKDTLCEYVFDSGEAVVISDVRLHAPVPVGGLIEQSLYSYAGTPLIFKGERLGTICCFNHSVRTMDEREVGLLKAIGRQVAIGVSNARLFEETERRLRELSMLSELGQRLAGAPLDAQQIAEIIARLFVEVMGVPEASISLLDPEQEGILRVLTDLYAEEGETQVESQIETFRLEDFPATAHVLETKEPVVVQRSDPNADPAERAYMQEYGSSTLVILPLAVKGEAIGIIELEAWQEEHEYSSRMLDLAKTLANQAAVALDNARLFAQAQQSADRAQALYETNRALSSSLEEEALMHTILEAVYHTLGCEHAVIAIADQKAGIIEARHIIWQGQFDVFPEWLQLVRYPLDHPDITPHIYRSGQTEIIGEWDDRFNRKVWDKFGHERFLRIFMPIKHGTQVLGVLEVGYDKAKRASVPQQELDLLAAFMDQAAVALQNARLFAEEQRARGLLDMRVQALDCLNDIGHKIDTAPPIPEFLEWACGRIGAAMQYPEQCIVAIEFEDHVHGTARARDLPNQMVQGLLVGGEQAGRITIAYTEDRDFVDEESALLGDISRRIGGYIENVRLFEETQAALAEVEATHRSYLRRAWQDHLRQRDMLDRSSFLYDGTPAEGPPGVSAVPDLWRPEMEQAVLDADHAPSIIQDGDGDGGRIGMAIPITIRGQTIGVLGVEAPDGHHQWTKEDMALIEAVSEQLAQTLETARLFADTQRRAERERLIAEVTAKIRASTDMQDILETAANELGRALGTSRAVVRVGIGELSASSGGAPQGETRPAGGPVLGPTGGNGQPETREDE